MTAISSTRPGFGAGVASMRGISFETENSFADFLDAPQTSRQKREKTFNFGELGMFGRFGASPFPGKEEEPQIGPVANLPQATQRGGQKKGIVDKSSSPPGSLPPANISAPPRLHDEANVPSVVGAVLQVVPKFSRQDHSGDNVGIRDYRQAAAQSDPGAKSSSTVPFSVPAQPPMISRVSIVPDDQNGTSQGGTPVALAPSEPHQATVLNAQAPSAQVSQPQGSQPQAAEAMVSETPVSEARVSEVQVTSVAAITDGPMLPAAPPQAAPAEGNGGTPAGPSAPPMGNDATTVSKRPVRCDENENSVNVTVSGPDDALVIVARSAQGGDIGLHQLMKDTAAEFGLELSDFRLNGVGSQRSLSTSLGGKNGGRAR